MKIASQLGFLLGLGLVWMGCGSKSDDKDTGADGTSGASETLQDITALEGTWVGGLCVVRSNNQGSTKQTYIVTRLNATTISYNSGLITFTSTDCSGTGTPPELTSNLGSVTFSATAILGASQYFRGQYSSSAGQVVPVIWALPTAQKLCVMTDQEPTVFPEAANIKAYVDALAADICFYKS